MELHIARNCNQLEMAILSASCRSANVDIEDLLAGKKSKDYVHARQIAVAIFHNYGIPLTRVSKVLGLNYKTVHRVLSRHRELAELQYWYNDMYFDALQSINDESVEKGDLISRLGKAEARIVRLEQRIDHLQQLILNK
jgi:hypothetical protein